VVAALGPGSPAASAASADAVEVMRILPQLCTPRHASLPALFALLLEDRAPLVIHCTAGKDRTGFACAPIDSLGAPDDLIAEDYLLTTASTGVIPQPAPISRDVRQVLASVASFLLAAGFDAISAEYAISRNYLGEAWASALGNARCSRRDTWRPNPSRLRRRTKLPQAAASISASRSAMTSSMPRSPADRGDLHQFPGADGAVAILQGDNQIPPPCS